MGGSYAKFALKDFADLQRLACSKKGVFDSFINKHWQVRGGERNRLVMQHVLHLFAQKLFG